MLIKMANKEELKTMIKCFRVHELQTLLSFAGRSKSGRKQELQDRALMLLKLQSEKLSYKIRHLYNLMQNCYSNNSIQYSCSEVNVSPSSTRDKEGDNCETCEKEEDSIAIVDDIECQDKDSFNEKDIDNLKEDSEKCLDQNNSSIQLLNPLYYPDHPDVKFKKLPFYKVLYELLKPSSLVPKDYHIQQKNSFMFYLTPQQAAAICLSRDSRQGVQEECSVQGQLRFCLLETTTKQEDSFPAGLVVRVNNKFCNIQEQPGRKKKDMYVKEASSPINITPLMKVNSSEANKIDVQWNTEYGLAYIIAVYVVQKKTSEDLLNRLKAKGVNSADHTRKIIREKLKEEDDGEIVTTSLRVSLMCPLGKMRLKFPCRASTCQHFQCFDALLFLQMNERKPTWMCPVCDNPAEYDKLLIDGYFEEILSSDKLPMNVNEIELHNDGSWSSLLIKAEENFKNDGSTMVKVEHEEEVIDVLVDEKQESSNDTTLSPMENLIAENSCINNSNKTESIGLEKRKVDEIDLTISDSDDEPLIWYKRRGSWNKRNAVINSVANSNQSSPSVINLEDSDSSDSLALMISNSISASGTPASIVTDYSSGTDLREDSATPKNNDSIMPWFIKSAVFF